jgi:hypothetical protein
MYLSINGRDFRIMVASMKKTVIFINGRFNAAAFTYTHLTHKVISLSNTDFPNALFLRNLTPTLDEGLLYTYFYSTIADLKYTFLLLLDCVMQLELP